MYKMIGINKMEINHETMVGIVQNWADEKFNFSTPLVAEVKYSIPKKCFIIVFDGSRK